jgi:hypothetical protein
VAFLSIKASIRDLDANRIRGAAHQGGDFAICHPDLRHRVISVIRKFAASTSRHIGNPGCGGA